MVGWLVYAKPFADKILNGLSIFSEIILLLIFVLIAPFTIEINDSARKLLGNKRE